MKAKHKLVGVIGASGTGKTTLCERSGFTFIRTDVSGVYKEMGLDPKVEMSLTQRLMVQTAILSRHRKIWDEWFNKFPGKEVHFVTDRTPVCFMTYTLAEISGYYKITEEEQLLLRKYLDACRQTLDDYFDGHFLLIGDPHKPAGLDDGKVRATQNLAYHHHYQYLTLGIAEAEVGGNTLKLCMNPHLEERIVSLRKYMATL